MFSEIELPNFIHWWKIRLPHHEEGYWFCPVCNDYISCLYKETFDIEQLLLLSIEIYKITLETMILKRRIISYMWQSKFSK